MNFETVCATCGTDFGVPYIASGTQVECPKCSTRIMLPEIHLGPGHVIGGFEIISGIGAGGMGDVFLARQLSMDRHVALKVLKPEISRDTAEVECFLSEIRAAARMEHPNMVAAYEAGEDDGCYYMAMSYVDGKPLDEVVDEEGPLPEARALQIIHKMAAALAYGWRQHEMIHRDVKPGNILLNARGEPKLSDMGLALKSRGADGDRLKEIAGTPNYMSPEQISCDRPLDFRSDMYSLGASLYQIVSGVVPFTAGTVEETLELIKSSRLTDPRESGAKLSAGCIDLLEIMMARDPAERYASWDACLEDIDRVLGGERATAARPASGASLLARRAPRKGAAQQRNAHAVKQVKTVPRVTRKAGTSARLAGGPSRKARLTTTGRPKKDLIRAYARERKGPSVGLIVGICMAFVACFVLVVAGKEMKRRSRIRSAQIAHQSEVWGLKNRIESIESSATAARPEELEHAVKTLNKLVRSTPRELVDEVKPTIKDARQKLSAKKRVAADTIWTSLSEEAEQIAARKQFSEAIDTLQSYSGPYAELIESRRTEMIKALRVRESARQEQLAAAAERRRAAEEESRRVQLRERLDAELTRRLASGDMEQAREFLEQTRADEVAESLDAQASLLLKQADDVITATDWAMDNYGPGGTVRNIEMQDGRLRCKVVSSVGGLLSVRPLSGSVSQTTAIRWSDLGAREKLRALAEDESPAAMTARAIAAALIGSEDVATECLTKAGTELAELLRPLVLKKTDQEELEIEIDLEYDAPPGDEISQIEASPLMDAFGRESAG